MVHIFIVSDSNREKKKPSVATVPGYVIPHATAPKFHDQTAIERPAFRVSDLEAPGAPGVPAPPAPGIDVMLVHDEAENKSDRGPWRALDVYTRNRIYSVDASMTCVEVVERATGRAEANHPFLGARLTGGQRRENDVLEITFPYPLPGTEAVFQKGSGRNPDFGTTSRVEQVVVRVRVLHAPLNGMAAAWERVARKVTV